MRVLVVEDDAAVAGALRSHLGRLGWTVDSTAALRPAWAAVCSEHFEVVLLDLTLPDGDGTTLLRRLRAAPPGGLPDPATPVLIMTARDEVAARIEGLDLGADDYVTKPFDPDELAARMRALQRRAAGRAQATLHWHDIAIDPASRTVTKAGHTVEVSAREFSVLLALMEARPRVLSRSHIEQRLYSFEQALESNAIDVYVHHLRRKLGDAVIRTVRGVGYYVATDEAA